MARRGVLVGGALPIVLLAACGTASGNGPTVLAAPTTTVPTSVVALTSPTTSSTDPSTAALTSGPSTTAPRPRPLLTDNRVFLEGDSIAESVGPRYSGAVCDALEPLGWNVTVDAVMGRNTSQAVRSLRSHLSSVGQVLVILIGHNDGIDPSSYHQNLSRLIDLVPEARWILLLTNYEFERGRDRMNLVLYDLANSDGRIQIVDWNDVVQGTDGAIKGDGIHLTTVGEHALADTIAGALGGAPTPPAGGSARRTCTTFRAPRPPSQGTGGSSSTSPTTSPGTEPGGSGGPTTGAPGTESPGTEPPATNGPPGGSGPPKGSPTTAPNPTDPPPKAAPPTT
jgi:lysophospholipase L1-like esterase